MFVCVRPRERRGLNEGNVRVVKGSAPPYLAARGSVLPSLERRDLSLTSAVDISRGSAVAAANSICHLLPLLPKAPRDGLHMDKQWNAKCEARNIALWALLRGTSAKLVESRSSDLEAVLDESDRFGGLLESRRLLAKLFQVEG
jgi:hypothetical protein